MNLTIEQLIKAIQDSTETYKIAVESQDYYARRGDFDVDCVQLINPYTLIAELEKILNPDTEGMAE